MNMNRVRDEFEETELFKNELRIHKPYFKHGHYFIDDDESADKFLCGAWEMFRELHQVTLKLTTECMLDALLAKEKMREVIISTNHRSQIEKDILLKQAEIAKRNGMARVLLKNI